MRLSISTLLATIVLLVASSTFAPSATAATEYNLWLPLADDVASCSGETVTVSGTQHIISRVTEDAQGQLHISFTRHTQGTGTGAVSGADYLIVDSVIRSEVTVNAQDGETSLTEGVQLLLIRKGEATSGDDTILHLVTRWTITADGTMTPDVLIDSVECR
jgi:hypothetical protein